MNQELQFKELNKKQKRQAERLYSECKKLKVKHLLPMKKCVYEVDKEGNLVGAICVERRKKQQKSS